MSLVIQEKHKKQTQTNEQNTRMSVTMTSQLAVTTNFFFDYKTTYEGSGCGWT